MSFLNANPVTVLAGLAALAGILYLLQRLRVRHRELTVPTTLFWRQAVEEARARVLVRRFRHPWAYILVLLICAFLWLGFAEPELGDTEVRDVVLLLDGSAGMERGTRFDEVLVVLEEEVQRQPRRRTRVIFCGARPRTLLAPGENAWLLGARLAPLRPELCPATVDGVVRGLAAARDGTRPMDVLVFGDAPLDEDAVALLPEGMQVFQATAATETRDENRGITALGVSAAASGTWNRVDVLVHVEGDALSADLGFSVRLGSQALDVSAERQVEGPRSQRIILRDLPARGELLAVSMQGEDALSADDEASVYLPARPLLGVALSESLRDLIGPVLAADPAVVLKLEEPAVAIKRAGESGGGDVPFLEFVPVDSQEESILLDHPEDESSRSVLLHSFDRLGLAEVDAMGIAEAAARPITLGARTGPRRAIRVWETLLSEELNFVQSRSFPLFIAQAVRWLAGNEDFAPDVAAGRPVKDDDHGYADEAGARLDPVGTAFTPPAAGSYRSERGEGLAASLLDPQVTLAGSAGGSREAQDLPAVRGGVELLTVLLLAAFALLLVEWFLVRSGRMP